MLDKIIWYLKANLIYRFRFKEIGSFSYIGKPVHIYGGKRVYIGKKVRIFPGLRIETHNGGRILIDNNVSIGQNFHIVSSNEELVIGSNSTISGNVLITNIDHSYSEIGTHILQQNHIIKTTIIGDNCFIGYGAVIQAGTTLGNQCIIGSNSVVRGVFPNYCVIVGAPAIIVKRYNSVKKLWEKTDSKGNFIT